MNVEVLPLGGFATNCVVLWAPGETACWIVDPGEEAPVLLEALAKHDLTPGAVMLTHGHFDHIGALPGLLARYPELPVHIAPGDAPMIGNPLNAWPPEYAGIARPDTLVADLTEGATLAANGLSARVLATPGHTPGSVCLLFESARTLVTGDTLFAGSCGRTDFPGGSPAAMKASLARLAALAPELAVLPGHGPTTTLAREIAHNPYLV